MGGRRVFEGKRQGFVVDEKRWQCAGDEVKYCDVIINLF